MPDGMTVRGYASIFGVVDLHGDIIQQGAFLKMLNSKGVNIKFLWQHDAKEPIGKLLRIAEDMKGLYIEAFVTSKTVKGREAIDLINQDIINGLSIGFNAVKSYKNENNIRVITEAQLWEVSLVTFPANTSSYLLKKSDENYELISALMSASEQIKSINQRSRNGKYC